MVKINSLFKKKDQGSKLKAFQESLRSKSGDLLQQDLKKQSQFIKKEMEEMQKMFPGSPKFLGRADYTIKKRKLGFVKIKYPNINKLREKVNRFAEKKEISDPRQQIRKLLKRYPGYADLRALNGIQIFNDASQSGLDAKKIKIIQGSLREVSRAMYNGGYNLFVMNWFIKIYVRYIDALKDKYLHEYNSTRNHFSNEIKKLSKDIHRKHLQLTLMSNVKNKLTGLQMLNAKLKNSVYLISNITPNEAKMASMAIKNEDGARKIGDGGKTASNIITVIMTLNMLMARIPILEDMVKLYQRSILNVNRDIVLQKIMVNNIQRVTDFQLSMASGDITQTHDIANKMFLDCLDIRKQYLDTGILTRQHEVDPLIKAVWIAKESKGLFKAEEYKKMLEHSMKILDVIFSKRVQVKSVHEMARGLQDDIHFIMIEEGWMK
jgi:hypothetical protein